MGGVLSIAMRNLIELEQLVEVALPSFPDQHVDVSNVRIEGDIRREGVNTCYVRGMFRAAGRTMYDELVGTYGHATALKRSMEDVSSRVLPQFVGDHLKDTTLDEITSHLRKKGLNPDLHHINGLSYQVLFELAYRESGLGLEEFGLLVGRYGAEENALFRFLARANPNWFIGKANHASRSFNVVTDFHPMVVVPGKMRESSYTRVSSNA